MRRERSGTTLLELLVVLVVAGIFAASVVPRLQSYVTALRVRGALDRVAGEIHRARMTAVQRGTTVQLVFGKAADGCVTSVRIVTKAADGTPQSTSTPLETAGRCLGHSGDSILVFNARGMLRPPSRSVFSIDPTHPDSVLLSIAGRVRRSY